MASKRELFKRAGALLIPLGLDNYKIILDGGVSNDSKLNRLAKIYKAIEKQHSQFLGRAVGPVERFKFYLDIFPSYNAVDGHLCSGKMLKASYDLVAQAGNDAISEMKKSIDSHLEATRSDRLVIPKFFENEEQDFIRQSTIWIDLCKNWASQNIAELSTLRREGCLTSGALPFMTHDG